MSLTSEELATKIRLILSQTERYAKIYALRDPPFDVDQRKGQYGPYTLPIAAPGDAQVTNEQVFLLRTLYAQCGPELQKRFPVLLINHLTTQTAAIVVHTAIDIGHLSALGKGLEEKKLDVETRISVWYRVREKLATESHRFTADDLAALEAMQAAELNRIPKSRRPPPPPVF
jgi:hypothetical protein